MTIRSKIIEGMNPKTISIPHGWPGPYNVNCLVGDESFDTIVGTPAYKAIPCKASKPNP